MSHWSNRVDARRGLGRTRGRGDDLVSLLANPQRKRDAARDEKRHCKCGGLLPALLLVVVFGKAGRHHCRLGHRRASAPKSSWSGQVRRALHKRCDAFAVQCKWSYWPDRGALPRSARTPSPVSATPNPKSNWRLASPDESGSDCTRGSGTAGLSERPVGPEGPVSRGVRFITVEDRCSEDVLEWEGVRFRSSRKPKHLRVQ